MNFVSYKRHRRKPFELQLTAMIDIFSMIVIFLIKGAVFGAAEVPVPSDIKLPASVSKEAVASATQVVILKGMVKIPGLEREMPVTDFKNEAVTSKLKVELKGLVDKVPTSERASGVLLNIVGDKATTYRELFDVIRVFRSSGFETMLFVATGPNEEAAAQAASKNRSTE